MAQNRLYLKCTICGDETSIARLNTNDQQWMASAYWFDNEKQWVKQFDAWIVHHATKCGKGALSVSLAAESSEQISIDLKE